VTIFASVEGELKKYNYKFALRNSYYIWQPV